MRAVNLKQIAEMAGVSLATASRVLSGSDYPVKEELRQRVLKVAEEVDYVPNANARGLLRGRSSTVGVLVGDVSDPFFSGMVAGIYDVADQSDYMVTVVNTFRATERELDTVRRLRAQRVDILIVAGSGIDDEEYTAGLGRSLQAFVNAGNASVLIGHHEVDESVAVCRVHFDNKAAAMMVANHLKELGHEEVAVLIGDPRLMSMRDRAAGFREVFGDGSHVYVVDPTRDGGYGVVDEILEQAPQVTAIAGAADQMAIGAGVRLRELGIDVPGQMSLTGFNDIDLSKDLVPSLTSAHVPLREMGRQAMQLGLRALEGEVAHHEVQPELAVRESSGPVRRSTDH